ncbi:MAG: DUF742 domain-containing protein [Actinomycetota bacterium]|nr:DUF742 domain-containing protein [Actinomycetota bacterium]
MGRPETGRTGARFGAPSRRARRGTDPDAAHGSPVTEPVAGQPITGPPVTEPSVTEPPVTEPPVGAAVAEVAEVAEVAGVAEEGGVGLTGARFGGRARKSRRERHAEKRRADRPPEPAAPVEDDVRPTVEIPRVVEEQAVAIAGRPYVVTGGRTKVRAELRVETLVSATGSAAGESGERHTVLTLCSHARSVSEVAALTGVPLGVARVLIDDLATEGRLRVHLGVEPDGGPDMALLDRVLAGLRRL